MIEDALAGKIELIITKSVSRFARNTVDSLTTIRELKERGVEVYFEEQNIYTLDSNGELLITIMSSLAQEESRNISENVSWGLRKRFADGKIMLPYKQFLGYRKGANDRPEIVPEEATIIRDIYYMFLEGKSPAFIARYLTDSGIPSPGGKPKWWPNSVKSILSNEKYKGDALLQKTFCTDFLTKRYKKNEGEVPQYYVENSHPAIIDPSVFDAVQVEIERRSRPERRNSTPHCFSGRIFCDDCGGEYGSRTWHSTDKYKARIWRCRALIQGKSSCNTPTIKEETLKAAFITVINKVISDKDIIIQICSELLNARYDPKPAIKKKAELSSEMQIVVDLIQRHITVNACVPQDQDEYQSILDDYEARYNSLMEQIINIDKERERIAAKQGQIKMYLDALKSQDLISEFDESLWLATVEQVRISADGALKFIFKDGTEIIG